MYTIEVKDKLDMAGVLKGTRKLTCTVQCAHEYLVIVQTCRDQKTKV